MRRLASAAASWPRSEAGALATARAFFVASAFVGDVMDQMVA